MSIRNRTVGFLIATALAGCAAPQIPAPQSRVKIGVIRVGPDEARTSGLEPIRGWGEGRDNTFMHCLELILAALGRPIDYTDLMGLSGAAFRVQFHRSEWDAGCPDPLVGYDCITRVMAAVGFNCRIYYVAWEQAQEAEQLRRDIVKSIDQGIPVLASNIIPPADWGIITGYRHNGREWWCRAYAQDARHVDQPAHGWPEAVAILSPPLPMPDMRQAYLTSIRRAVELYSTSSAGEYLLGRAALEQWCDQLTKVVDRSYLHPNAWIYVSLLDARVAAAAYLKRAAQILPAARTNLQAAAGLYEREVKLLADTLPSVPFQGQFSSGLPPQEDRSRQISALREAMELERQAVEILRRFK